jgi:hypothetical protein
MVRFQVLTAVTIKSTIFVDVTSAEVYRCFGKTHCLYPHGKRVSPASKQEAASNVNTKSSAWTLNLLFYREYWGSKLLRNSSNFYQTIWHSILEDSTVLIGGYVDSRFMSVLQVYIDSKSLYAFQRQLYACSAFSPKFSLFAIGELKFSFIN